MAKSNYHDNREWRKITLFHAIYQTFSKFSQKIGFANVAEKW